MPGGSSAWTHLLCHFSRPLHSACLLPGRPFPSSSYSKPLLLLWDLAQMLPFLQLPPGDLWTLQALTKMSEPYSENNSAALGRAHPGPQRLSRQKVHADIRPDRPPLGSGNQGVMYSRTAACGPCIGAAQRQPELWITSDTIFSPGEKIQFSEFVQHFMYHEVTVSRQQPRESLVPRLLLLSCSRSSFASHRASCSQSLTVSIVSKTWGKQLSVITVSLLGNLYF